MSTPKRVLQLVHLGHHVPLLLGPRCLVDDIVAEMSENNGITLLGSTVP